METDGSGTIAGLEAVPAVNSQHCSGCGRCVAACPADIITLHVTGHRKTAIIRFQERCTRCRLCVKSCPIAAFDQGGLVPESPKAQAGPQHVTRRRGQHPG